MMPVVTSSQSLAHINLAMVVITATMKSGMMRQLGFNSSACQTPSNNHIARDCHMGKLGAVKNDMFKGGTALQQSMLSYCVCCMYLAGLKVYSTEIGLCALCSSSLECVASTAGDCEDEECALCHHKAPGITLPYKLICRLTYFHDDGTELVACHAPEPCCQSSATIIGIRAATGRSNMKEWHRGASCLCPPSQHQYSIADMTFVVAMCSCGAAAGADDCLFLEALMHPAGADMLASHQGSITEKNQLLSYGMPAAAFMLASTKSGLAMLEPQGLHEIQLVICLLEISR